MKIEIDNPEGFRNAVKYFLIMLAIGAAVMIAILLAPQAVFDNFSTFAYGITKWIVLNVLVWSADRFLFKEIDTVKTIKESQYAAVAYALFFLGEFIGAAACISAS